MREKKPQLPPEALNKLLENSSEGIAVISVDGAPSYISPAIEKILGYKENEYMRTNVFTLVKGSYVSELKTVIEQVAADPEMTGEFTAQMLHKDGSLRWVKATFTNMLLEPSIKGIVYHFRDITIKQLALEQLKSNELRLKQAQEMAHVGTWELNLTTMMTIWSDELCRIYGLSPEDNIHSYESWLSFIHPEDIEHVTQISPAGLASLKDFQFYYRILLRDGTIKYLHDECRFKFDGHGKPLFLYGAIHDVTGSKEAERRLVKINRLYSFKSSINRTIVHVNDQQALFRDACNIAVNIGQFKVAWIGIFDQARQKINLIENVGMETEDIALFTDARYDDNGPQSYVLRSGKPFVGNDALQDLELNRWKKYASTRGYGSFIVLPIRKSGIIIGTLNLYAAQRDTFDAAEVRLLEEAADDISFALDVFEKELFRSKAESKLKYSELRLKQAQEIAHIGSWELDLSTDIATWSEEALRIYGLPTKDSIQSQESWLSYIHPEDLDYVKQVRRNAESTLSNSDFYHRIVRKDGIVRHIYTQAHFEFDKEGKPVRLYGVAHDVTEMKEAQKLLAQSEANLRLIIDLVPQSIFVKDFNGKYLFVNKSFAALYGLMPEELIYRSSMESVTVPEEGLKFLEQDRNVIRTGEKKIFPEEKFTGPTGVKKIFHTTKVPFTPVMGNKSVLGIADDITEQKKNEVEREKMIADILQRNESLQQFSYIISHNLRGPVTTIIALSELFNNGLLDEEEMMKFPEQLITLVRQIDEVIKDLNKILQVKAGINETKEVVNFSVLVETIQTSLSDLMQKNDVRIITDFSGANELVTLKGYIYSIFYNLIANSIKYRQPRLPPLIRIKSIKRDGKLIISFKDNGIGIDILKNAGQVFNLYKRFHHHVDGKGVGLFMVKTQVEALGGQISVASEVNAGTEFTIEFVL